MATDEVHDSPCTLRDILQQKNTRLLADSLDFDTLSLHEFSGSMLTPGRIYEALQKPESKGGLRLTLTIAANKCLQTPADAEAMRTRRGRQECISRAIDQFFWEVASSVGDRVNGAHVVYIDPRVHGHVDLLVHAALRMHNIFVDNGVPPESVIVSIPATEAGLRAVQILEPQGVLTNLYLVTSLVHAALCVEAKTAAISVSVGPLLEELESRADKVYEDLSKHPGIENIKTILKYFEVNNIRTKVLGTAFRSLEEVGQLSDCDAVCITDKQANRLQWSTVPIPDPHAEESRRVELRAQQAKYPTDLLTRPSQSESPRKSDKSDTTDSPQRAGSSTGSGSASSGFERWLSPESRSVTKAVLETELRQLEHDMDQIQRYVEAEMDRLAAFRAPNTAAEPWAVGYREGSPGLQWKASRDEKSPVRTPTSSPFAKAKMKKTYISTAFEQFLKESDSSEEQDEDDVF